MRAFFFHLLYDDRIRPDGDNAKYYNNVRRREARRRGRPMSRPMRLTSAPYVFGVRRIYYYYYCCCCFSCYNNRTTKRRISDFLSGDYCRIRAVRKARKMSEIDRRQSSFQTALFPKSSSPRED